MKGREIKGAATTSFSRAHLTLNIPKSICSPARLSEHHKRLHNHHNQRLLLMAKNKQMGGGQDISEPSSPKVTCAGQIKVRPKKSSCKNWQSVMEEIERIHNKKKSKKRPAWAEALGFKKEVMQFLTCLKNISFDFRCFGSFPTGPDITTDNEDDDEIENNEENSLQLDNEDDDESSRAVFSKWFMAIKENQNGIVNKDDDEEQPSVPPPNALLLMRCRSAPAINLMDVAKEEEDDDDDEKEMDFDAEKAKLKKLFMEEEMMMMKRKKDNNLVVMRYDTDFYKLSCDVAEETWVVGGSGDGGSHGGGRDLFSRSRSCKR